MIGINKEGEISKIFYFTLNFLKIYHGKEELQTYLVKTKFYMLGSTPFKGLKFASKTFPPSHWQPWSKSVNIGQNKSKQENTSHKKQCLIEVKKE